MVSETDREALVRLELASRSVIMSDGYPSLKLRTNEEAADIVLAAGFRRVEVTDEMVERASFAFWESIDPGTGAEYEPGDVRAMRAALEAALNGSVPEVRSTT